jgi:glycine/serine hydroxymethyltransferase
MKEAEMASIASLIIDVLQAPRDEGTIRRVRETVQNLCSHFPLFYED